MLPRCVPTFAVVALAALALGACGGSADGGGGSGEQPLELLLDFFVNPDHAGIYTALDSGYFADADLAVDVRVPADPAGPIKQVAAGQADLAVSYEPEVMLARDQGLDVVAVAALVHGPLTSLISLPAAGVENPADLAGKTVVTAGIPYQDAYLDTILAGAGVDPSAVNRVDVGFNLLPPLLSGRADAMLGGFVNVEGVQLAQRGADPRVVPVDELGIPTYDELVLVASAETLREKPDEIGAFIAALQRGTKAAVADPDAAAASIVAAGDRLDPGLTRAELDETLPRLQARPGKPFGYMAPAQWRTFGSYLADNGQLDAAPKPDEVLTNDLLPPAK